MKERTFGPLGNNKYDDYSNIIHDSGTHLVNLINDILDISKIESGKYTLTKEDIDPVALIDTTLAMISPLVSEKKPAIIFVDDRRIA